MPADYYELLGVAPRRHARRDQAGLPPARPRAAPRRQPRRPRRRGAVQGGRRRLRDAVRSRAPPALRHVRPRRRRPGGGDPFGFGGGGLGDIFDAFFGGGGGVRPRCAARRRARRAAPTSRSSSTSSSRRRCSAASRHHGAHRGRLRDLPGDRRRAGHLAVDVPRLRRRGPGAPGAPVDPRPDGHGRPVRTVRRARPDHRAPCTDCRGEGRRVEDKTYTVDIPAGVDTGSTLAAHRPRRRGHPRRRLRRPLRPRAGEPARRGSTRDGLRPRPRAAPPDHPGGAGRPPPFETLDGDGGPRRSRAARRPGRVFRLRGRGVPHVEGRGRGDLLVQVVVDTPTDCARGGRPAAPARRAAGRGGRAGRHRVLSRIRSAFK